MDRTISRYFDPLCTLRFKSVFGALTHFGAGALWITTYAFFLIFFPNHFTRLVLTLIVAEAVGLLAVVILKFMTKRKRPVARHRYSRFTPWNKYSFPSHHSLRSFAIAVIAGTYFPGLLPFLLLMAATVSFSRIYLSKHYLSDVLVGVLLGVFLAVASLRFFYEPSSLQSPAASFIP